LEGQYSGNDFPFVERSSAMVIDPSSHWGVAMLDYTDYERLTCPVVYART
jgi:hypothetical protein